MDLVWEKDVWHGGAHINQSWMCIHPTCMDFKISKQWTKPWKLPDGVERL
jgi:hypothetical protein